MAINYLDKDGLILLWDKIKNALVNKVDKIDGKGLSTNDFTTDEKIKLSSVESGAQANIIQGIQANGTNVVLSNKIASISIPTSTSQLTNDAHFITINDVPSGSSISAMSYKGAKASINELPASGNTVGDVWHVSANGGEYAWDGSEWQELGSIIDLSNYIENSDLVAVTTAEINTICV